jgi:hypothetical protein
MNAINSKNIRLLALLLGTFSAACADAATVTLLDENFDDGSNTSIQSLLSSNPTALPTGTLWSSTATANSVNLRLGTDSINSYNTGNPLQRFALTAGSNFFLPATSANKFLVMGDDSGQLAGSPTSGSFGFATPFSLVSGTTDITISFDWVFSTFLFGSATPDTDQFKVGISGSGFNIDSPLATTASVIDQSIFSYGKTYGPDSVTLAVASLGAADVNGNYWLSFGLFENASSVTNGAVGIDNIKITANLAPVPLPAATWSFLTGFMGLLALGKRKRSSL